MKTSVLTPIIVVLGLMAAFVVVAVDGSTRSGYGHLLASQFSECEPLVQASAEQKVVLRVDDVWAETDPAVQVRMMEDAAERNVPLVLGVVPNRLSENKELYYYLANNNCHFEIALHGWDHQLIEGGPEFGKLTVDGAYRRIMDGKQVLEEIAKKPINTFIPPQDKYSLGTVTALKEAGIPVLSSEGVGRFDYDVAAYDFVREDLMINYEVLSACKRNMREDNVCIIVLQPHNYLNERGEIDKERYGNYLGLLDSLGVANVEITTIDNLYKQTN